TPCDLTRSSACCNRGVVGVRPRRRSAARSSAAHGRGRCGRSACGAKTTALTLAIAAPASRRRAAETIGGEPLLPDRKVSRVATVPLALPSRSAAIRRGPARPWVSASRRARALVITMPSVIQRGTETFRIRSVAPVDVPSTRRRKVPEGRWVLREGFSTERTRIPPMVSAARLREAGAAIARVNAVVLAPQADLPHRPRPCAADDRAADRRRGRTPTTPLLQQADERVRSHGVPAGASVFLHGDVWGGNMLWDGDRCVALIDWKGAGVGDPGVDLGSLRMQMALQYGQDAPAHVLEGWQRQAGRAAISARSSG